MASSTLVNANEILKKAFPRFPAPPLHPPMPPMPPRELMDLLEALDVIQAHGWRAVKTGKRAAQDLEEALAEATEAQTALLLGEALLAARKENQGRALNRRQRKLTEQVARFIQGR